MIHILICLTSMTTQTVSRTLPLFVVWISPPLLQLGFSTLCLFRQRLQLAPSKELEKALMVFFDIFAAQRSSAGSVQYHAYCNSVGKNPLIDHSLPASCHFGIGFTISMGMATFSL